MARRRSRKKRVTVEEALKNPELMRRARELFSKRSKRSKTMDLRYAGKVPKYFETWLKHPERYDLPTIDMGKEKKKMKKKPRVVMGLRYNGVNVILYVRGDTYQIKEELKKQKLIWSPLDREWWTVITKYKPPSLREFAKKKGLKLTSKNYSKIVEMYDKEVKKEAKETLKNAMKKVEEIAKKLRKRAKVEIVKPKI